MSTGEPGNEVFTVYRERDNPAKFFVFERYADDDAFAAHIGAPMAQSLQTALGILIEDGSQLTS